jgi:hypothetical protein
MKLVRLTTTDGIELEARWDVPEAPATAAMVFCHPDPRQRGTMNAPLMVAVAGRLASAGFAVLRFNFRGVGTSTGSSTGGDGEIDDVASAIAEARATFPDIPQGLAGWSFGAATSLRWLGRTGAAMPWCGIAPPVSAGLVPDLPNGTDLADSSRTFIIGDRDQFTTVRGLTEYANAVGGTVEVLAGSDHFFHFRENRVADIVAAALS